MSCQLFYFVLYSRDTGRTTNQQYFAKFRSCDTCIFQSVLYRCCCTLYQISCQIIKLCTGQVHVKVLWTFCRCCDKWQVDVGCIGGRKFFLRFLCCFFQTLHSHLIGRKVYAFCLFELFNHVICDLVIKVITTKTVVSGCGQYFDDAVTDLDNRYIKCTTT